MSNLIQIKRSAVNANPVGLANGELAFTSNGDVLFIGSPNGSVIAIGGLRTPGVLTANQALVANTTSGIDKILVANLVPTQIWANGSFGTNGQLLTSNGSSLFWQTPAPGVVGSNTQIQFNDSGDLGSDPNFTFNKDTDTLTVGTATVNSTNFSGTSNNSTNLNGQPATYYTNATNITTGTLDTARLPATANITTAINVGSNVNLTTTTVSVGNTTVNVSISAGSLTVNGTDVITSISGNAATAYTNAVAYSSNADNLTSGTVATARLGSGTANSTTFLSGDQTYKTAVTGILSGNGLSGGPISTSGTLSVLAGSGIVSNSSGVFVNAGTGVTVNSTGVHIGQAVATTSNVTFADLTVNGNTKLGDAATDVVTFVAKANSDILPSANATYNLGTTNERWNYIYSANVHSAFGYITGNLEVGGDLIVTGNLVTVNTSSLIVQDPLIYLAGNNYISDLVDIGFVGNYFDGSTSRHTGVIRHADSQEFYVFDNYALEPNTNVIDITDPSFRVATLNAYLNSGALQTNSTALSITSNSTVSVSLTANTLSLSTALAGNSGGTGLSSITNNAILVGNSSNGFNQLTLGASGYVLQSNGTALVYDTLDGGTF